jgi:hypothetical protein
MAWVYSRRRRYRAVGRALTPNEHATLAPYFGERLLLSVLIAEVDRIEDSFLVRWLRALGWKRVPGGLEWVFGMAFVDAVAIRAAAAHREQRKMPLLFHELVHIAQYQQVGTMVFLMRYIRGWLANGQDYMSIPIEQEAYALQDRFASGEVFEVAGEVQTPG